MIYLDYNATTPIAEEVREAMMPYLAEEYGNPSGKYYNQAIKAQDAVENAREKVADLLGVDSQSIIFTAGASESTNLILKGYMDYRRHYLDGKNHLITSAIEHKATMNTCKFLAGEIYSNKDSTTGLFKANKIVDRGYQVTFLDVNRYGQIDSEALEKAIHTDTALVSISHVNNEIGTLQDIEGMARICKSNGVSFHVDVTQSVGKLPLRLKEIGVDFASCSAHKIYGPKGVGAAYLKSDEYGIEPLTALIHGGEQENGFRAGTLAVHDIVGFGKAAEIAIRDRNKMESKIQKIDRQLVEALLQIKGVSMLVPDDYRLPGIISILVERPRFHNERFIKEVANRIAISTGSACTAGEPSHVIQAIGLQDATSRVIRISLGKYTEYQDVEQVIEVIKSAL